MAGVSLSELVKGLNKAAEEADPSTLTASDPKDEPVATKNKPTTFVSDELYNMLCEQYTREMYSSEIYRGMAVYCDDIGLTGFAKYFQGQGDEERAHADEFRNFIVDKLNMSLKMKSIDAVESVYDTPLAVFEAQLEHEKKVTGWINDLVLKAAEEDNWYAIPFLQGMLQEQMEEEQKSYTFLLRVKMAGDGAGLILLDHEIGKTE